MCVCMYVYIYIYMYIYRNLWYPIIEGIFLYEGVLGLYSLGNFKQHQRRGTEP